MNIRPSAAIRHNYNGIAELCKKNGTSYSVVMLTGIMEQEQSERFEKMLISASLQSKMLLLENSQFTLYNSCSQSAVS